MFGGGGKKKDPVKESCREVEKAHRASDRTLQREQLNLEKQEKELEISIKNAARKGNQQLVRVHAKNLLLVRQQKTKIMGMSAKMTSINTQTKLMASQARVGQSMGAVSGAMSAINSTISPQELGQTMQNFSKESDKLEMKQEMMDDVLDDLNEADDEEADDLVNSVLDEIGIDINAALPSANKSKLPEASSSATEDKDEEDLINRLAALK